MKKNYLSTSGFRCSYTEQNNRCVLVSRCQQRTASVFNYTLSTEHAMGMGSVLSREMSHLTTKVAPSSQSMETDLLGVPIASRQYTKVKQISLLTAAKGKIPRQHS